MSSSRNRSCSCSSLLSSESLHSCWPPSASTGSRLTQSRSAPMKSASAWRLEQTAAESCRWFSAAHFFRRGSVCSLVSLRRFSRGTSWPASYTESSPGIQPSSLPPWPSLVLLHSSRRFCLPVARLTSNLWSLSVSNDSQRGLDLVDANAASELSDSIEPSYILNAGLGRVGESVNS